MSKILLELVALMFILNSCGLFETRSPEEPESGKTIFPPAVSSDILLTNFFKSINSKNIDAYVECFSDSTEGAFTYRFLPSADALGKYGSFFENWIVQDERRYFTALTSAIPEGINLGITLKDSTIAFVSGDSTIFIAEYTLDVPQTTQNSQRYYKGKIKLTMAGQAGGVWKILRWADAPPVGSDTIKATWSMLKAHY